jgi:hypothetical protein
MVQKELLTKTDYAAVGAEISMKTAIQFTKAYADTHPNENLSYHLGRNIIEHILAQPGCVGMRFYYGYNNEGQKTLVYVGLDVNGNDLVKQTMVTENGVMMSSEEGIVADVIGLGGWPFTR